LDQSESNVQGGGVGIVGDDGKLFDIFFPTSAAECWLTGLDAQYHTLASGIEYEVDICDKINAAEFTAIAGKLAEYLVSDPVRLQKVGWTLGTEPLLVVRKMVGDPLAYNASFTIHVEPHPPRTARCRLVLSTEIDDHGTLGHPDRATLIRTERSLPLGELYQD
jgi:hypothetical protein